MKQSDVLNGWLFERSDVLNGWTTEIHRFQLAAIRGVTLRTVQNYELKNLFPKSQDVVNKLCEALSVSPDYLITDDDKFLNEAYDKDGERGRRSAELVLERATALFAGGEISDHDKDILMKALQDAYWKAKEINKKYTPKKYRK